MLTKDPFVTGFQNPSVLSTQVLLTGPHRQFRTGKHGYRFIDQFDWNGKSWRLRFQAFVKTKRSGTTHGMLEGGLTEKPCVHISIRPASNPVLGKLFAAHLKERARKEARRRETGWDLKRLPDGIQAIFDLNRVRVFRKKNRIGSFASCNVTIGDVLYLCQFHICERAEFLLKPTEWDWSPGPRAGIPSLGKRR